MEIIESYHFSFEATGVEPVDRILKEIARAGKLYHHTQDWCDSYNGIALTPVEHIQIAADEAAKYIEMLRQLRREKTA